MIRPPGRSRVTIFRKARCRDVGGTCIQTALNQIRSNVNPVRKTFSRAGLEPEQRGPVKAVSAPADASNGRLHLDQGDVGEHGREHPYNFANKGGLQGLLPSCPPLEI